MKHFIFDFNRDKGLVSSFLESRCKAHNSEIKSEAWFYWKFKENPYGESILACATENDQIVGCVAYGIQFFSFKGSTIKGAVSFENFVHPEFQRQGIFYRLLKLGESEIKKDRSIKFMLNFPNSNSLRGFLKMGWTQVDIAEYWIKGRNLLSIPFNLPSIRKGFQPNASNFEMLKKPHNLYEDHSQELTNMISSAYIEWRFFSFPVAEYMVLEGPDFYSMGRVGFRGKVKEMQILFLNIKDVSTFSFSDFISFCKSKCNHDIISFPISRNNPVRKYLKANHFFKVPNRTNVCYNIIDSNLFSETDIENISFDSIIYHTY